MWVTLMDADRRSGREDLLGSASSDVPTLSQAQHSTHLVELTWSASVTELMFSKEHYVVIGCLFCEGGKENGVL